MLGSRLLFSIAILTVLAGCGGPDSTERVMPTEVATCGGQAIKSRYIVRYKSGHTAIVQNHDREKFKEEFVRPNLDDIEYIEYDQKISVRDFAPELLETTRSVQPTLIDNWGLSRIRSEVAWQQGYYGQNTIIAVIDSGVDISHPALANQVLQNSNEIVNGIDDDGNGYVDDIIGYNFLDQSPLVTDQIAHGTHVAGIIAAKHSDNHVSTTHVQGIAPQAKILPLKFIDSNGGTLSGAIEALEYARRAGVHIINASWGGPACSRSLSDKIKDVTNEGIIFVTAAGNSGQNLDLRPEYPAAFSHFLQLTVGSSGIMDGMSSFSNYSRRLVHLFAPGFDITSTLPGQAVGRQSGTSMATPFVAGALAVLRSAQPTATPEELIDALLSSVDTNPTYQNATQGRLNVASALKKLLSSASH